MDQTKEDAHRQNAAKGADFFNEELKGIAAEDHFFARCREKERDSDRKPA